MKIVSASRRTDIPAFYSEWLMNRLRDGYAKVPNPFNQRQISTVLLRPETVACLMLISKDPRPMVRHLEELERRNYRFCFQVTATGLPRFLEPGVPPADEVVRAMCAIAGRIGSSKVTWRFDPIILSRDISPESVVRSFSRLAAALRGSVGTVIISFARQYRTVGRRIRALAGEEGVVFLGEDFATKGRIASALADIATGAGMRIQSCADPLDMTRFGVPPGRCVDPDLIRDLFEVQVPVRKDPAQRTECLCARSVDIGIYGTCPHRCIYCYASCDAAFARGRRHDPSSPSLLADIGEPLEPQGSLFTPR